jgi:hypothetical protein
MTIVEIDKTLPVQQARPRLAAAIRGAAGAGVVPSPAQVWRRPFEKAMIAA